MYNHWLYLGYWFINSVVLYIASFVFPTATISLGSWRFSSGEASFYAGFFLTFLIWVWWDFAIARKFDFSNTVMTFVFFVFVNSFSLLAIARFSYFTGFTLSSLLWTFILSFVLTCMQRIVRVLIVRQRAFRS